MTEADHILIDLVHHLLEEKMIFLRPRTIEEQRLALLEILEPLLDLLGLAIQETMITVRTN